jgi:hypothetical protein
LKIQAALIGLLFTVSTFNALAQPWEFNQPLTITTTEGKGIFHHLDSAGRHNIAVSADTIAVAWEDNRDGTPRIYLARKDRTARKFSTEIKISGKGEAFEPSLVALDNNRFALAWEEDARIHARLVTPGGLGPVVILGNNDAMQPGLARNKHQLLLVYSLRDGHYGRIWFQPIKMDGTTLHPDPGCAVDAKPVQDEQLYPAIVNLDDHTLIAWEDRRPGHTIIMAAQNIQPAPCRFTPPQRINEWRRGQSSKYGKGYGVARVALARYGSEGAIAVWADKRNFREGYDIYAAYYQPGNKQLFGPNMKIQDSFGGVAQQWHATVAGDASGKLVVGWDDKRDGDANIMLSWPEGNEWSDDFAVPGAAGSGEQNHPTICLDQEGNLHLAWVERATVNGPTRLRYLFGKAIKP